MRVPSVGWVFADRFALGRHRQAMQSTRSMALTIVRRRCNAHHRSRFRRRRPIDLRELVKPLVIKGQLHVAARRGAMTRAVKLAVEQATCLLDDAACRAVRCRRGHRP